jgi:UDP-GlcNAc3NAcA epimerase
VLATIHRADNTHDPLRLCAIMQGLGDGAESVVFPMHPRTAVAIRASDLAVPANVRVVDPVGHAELVRLAAAARVVVTDPGGLQKETYWLGTP